MPLLADHIYTSKAPPAPTGLLTTIDQLPALLKRQYPTSYKPKSAAIKRSAAALVEQTPLDLTVKASAQIGFQSITPPSTPSPPPKKRYKFTVTSDEEEGVTVKSTTTIAVGDAGEINTKQQQQQRGDKTKCNNKPTAKQVTPQKPIEAKEEANLKMGKSVRPGKKQKRNKATRKLKFDEDTSSPVSGTIIRRLEEIEDEDQIGDIDPEYNIVEVTEEAKAEIAAIVNVIGDYVCKLCRKSFEDAFELARHRCSCIVLLEYRCPECGKRFNCPANLASHRRWHKPRPQGKAAAASKTNSSASSSAASKSGDKFPCKDCNKSFKRLAYLKKHQLTHQNSNQVVMEESSRNSHSNESFYSNEEPRTMMMMKEEELDEEEGEEVEEVAVESSYQPTKLQTFTQIVFRYATSMNGGGHSGAEDEEENIIYSHSSRGSSPVSMYSAPSPHHHHHPVRRTDDENLAAAALAALARNGSSVIRHTTLSV